MVLTTGDVTAFAPELGRLHHAQVPDKSIRARPVAFIDDENIGDLQQPGFHGLNVISPLRREYDQRGIGQSGNFDFILPYPNRFNDDQESKGATFNRSAISMIRGCRPPREPLVDRLRIKTPG